MIHVLLKIKVYLGSKEVLLRGRSLNKKSSRFDQ